MLVLTIHDHQAIRIGEAVIRVKPHKVGKTTQYRIVIDAPKRVKVERLPIDLGDER